MYGANAIVFDENIHLAGWGARLIYNEVAEGYSGIVSDRQSGASDEGARIVEERIFPYLKAFMAACREDMDSYNRTLRFDSNEPFFWSPPEDPKVKFVANAQMSYGYLYVKGVVEK